MIDFPCTARSPDGLIVTWRTTAGVNSMPEEYPYIPGLPLDIRIRLPKNVKCNLTTLIRAKNSVGVSSPTVKHVGKLITAFPGTMASQ